MRPLDVDSLNCRGEWTHVPAVYVAEFTGGVLKVGYTHSAYKRRQQLGYTYKREGLRLQRFVAFRALHGFGSERWLIRRVRNHASTLRGVEWFTGAPFGLLVTLARQATTRTAPPLPQRKRKVAHAG